MNNNAKTIKIYQASTHPPQRLEYRFLNSKNKKKKEKKRNEHLPDRRHSRGY